MLPKFVFEYMFNNSMEKGHLNIFEFSKYLKRCFNVPRMLHPQFIKAKELQFFDFKNYRADATFKKLFLQYQGFGY